MSVTPGDRIGPYEVVGLLGAGRMGEVYRARDHRLRRDVALKVVSPRFAPDAQRRARLTREAHLLATLNHPNIATLYGLEEAGGIQALVLELVEGETLADRLAGRPGGLRLPDALAVAQQVAAALDAAHERGIVHRDLKPANIALRPDGTVKLLDFGLATVLDRSSGGGLATATVTLGESAGAILGTPAYMSPEQARGLPVDRRTDIWAFGCVLYEMLAGRRAFEGDRASDVVARIIEREPDLNALPPATPAAVRRVVRRCLVKDPGQRLRDIGDAHADLADLADWTDTTPPDPVAPARSVSRRDVLVTAASAAAAGTGVWLGIRPRTGAESPRSDHGDIVPPRGVTFRFLRNGEGGFDISPNGRWIAVTARADDGTALLYLWSRDTGDFRGLPGTEDAYAPFWSPDSQWIAFFTPQKLKRIHVTSGARAQDLTNVEIPIVNRGTWGPNDVILFAIPSSPDDPQPLRRTSATGGGFTEVPGTEPGRSPHFLPDNRYLFLRRDELWLGSLEPRRPPTPIGPLGDGAPRIHYSAGHVVYHLRDGEMMARPLDIGRGRFSGDAFRVPVPMGRRIFIGGPMVEYAVNAEGMLAFPPAEASLSRLVWRDREGNELDEIGGEGDEHYTPSIAPGDSRIAYAQCSRGSRHLDVLIADPDGRRSRPVTRPPGIHANPVWSPDGHMLVYSDYERGGLYGITIDANTPHLVHPFNGLLAQSLDWSDDGRFLLFTHISRSSEIMALDRETGKTWSVLGHNLGASKAQFDPGQPQWMVYDYDEHGDRVREVYAVPFVLSETWRGLGVKVSEGGGVMPRWRGREIFYLTMEGTLMAARVSIDGGVFRVIDREPLFRATPPERRVPSFEYDVTSDGQRILMVEPVSSPQSQRLRLITNWLALGR